MGSTRPSLIETLVAEEIRRMVADAVSADSLISASDCAAQILRTYPTCGLGEREIADRLMMAAMAASVAVEFGRTRKGNLAAETA